MLTKQGAGVSEGSDLWVREAGEQHQQRGEEELVIDEAVLTGGHQNSGKLTEASPEVFQLVAWRGERVAGRVLGGGGSGVESIFFTKEVLWGKAVFSSAN